jgi:poly(3-hydroxybutyrate) depolymerase
MPSSLSHCAPFLLAPALVLVACSPGGGRKTSDDLSTPGMRTVGVTVDGKEREATVHVPAGLSAGTPAPVVIVLHGTGGSGANFYESAGWVAKAEAEKFVAVFPSSLKYCIYEDSNFDGKAQANEFSVTTKWADGKLGTESQGLCNAAQRDELVSSGDGDVATATADDVTFIRTLLAELDTSLDLDPKRISVTGFSNGANMAARLSVEATDLFAAAAAAGGGLRVTTLAARPMPVVVSLGSKDPSALAKTGVLEDPSDNLAAFPMNESALEVPYISNMVGEFATAMGISPGKPTFAIETVAGEKLLRAEYTGPAANQRIVLLMVGGMTHMYPNGDNNPVVMADVLWDVFKEASLP